MKNVHSSIEALAADAPIVVLTGAGISKESGLSTFRDDDGIWATVRIEDVATPEAFARNPEAVHDFYNMRRRLLTEKQVEPNAAHYALVELEQAWPGGVLIVTQNVDSLHEQAGTQNLIHMHGRHREARCNHCGYVVEWHGDMSTADVCGGCEKSGGLRPNVVWFGEMPMDMDLIEEALMNCGLFISIGTSGNVYPAAGFVRLVERTEAVSVELNLEPSEGARNFDHARYGPATEVVPVFVSDLLSSIE